MVTFFGNGILQTILVTLAWTPYCPPWTCVCPPWTCMCPPWTGVCPSSAKIFKNLKKIKLPKIKELRGQSSCEISFKNINSFWDKIEEINQLGQPIVQGGQTPVQPGWTYVCPQWRDVQPAWTYVCPQWTGVSPTFSLKGEVNISY